MRSGAWIFAALAITACNAVLGIEEPTRVNSLGGATSNDNSGAGNASGGNASGSNEDRQDCVLNSNCPETQTCVFRVCSPPCEEDRDCLPNERCLQLQDTTACVKGEFAICTTQSQCPDGSTCSDGECRNPCVAVDAGEQIIAAGDAAASLSCLGDQECVQGVCRGTDAGHDPQQGDAGLLEDGATPVGDAGQNQCVLGTKHCQGNELFECGPAHTWENPQTCVFGCRNDVCNECSPDDKTCEDGRPKVCQSDGTWSLGTQCPVLCYQGTCATQCPDGVEQCDDVIPQTCEGGAWVDGAPCALGCYGEGKCAVCEPGTTRCANGNSDEQLCDAQGQWAGFTSCDLGCIDDRCAICTPDDEQCVNPSQRRLCNALGRWGAPADCQYGCASNACVPCPAAPSECMGAATGDVCASVTSYVSCSQDGNGCVTASTEQSCAEGTCSGSPGAAACACTGEPNDCTGAGTVCRNNSLAVCDLDTNDCVVTTDEDPCPSPQVCSGSFPDAQCVCPTVAQCDAANEMDGNYCSGSALVSCTDAGQTCQAVDSHSCVVLANEQCVGSHPNAKCEKAYGNAADGGGSSNLATNFLFGVPVTISQSVTLRRLGVISRESLGKIRLALYTNVSGAPSAWLASALPAGNLAVGRNEYAINDPVTTVTLTAGTYWIVGSVEVQTSLGQGAPGAVRYKTWNPWSTPFPATLTGTTPDTLGQFDFYLIGLP